jgi:thiol-disulfide isomerase/thioredoxin
MADPTPPPFSSAGGGIVYVYEKGEDGAVRITLAGTTPGPGRPELRPVLLDAGKKRYLPESIPGGGWSGLSGGPIVALSRWRMDPKVLPAERVALIGIEAMTPEFHRAAGREATERARKAGVEVLPWPEVGQNYSFRLTTTDGRVIRSEGLKGKVVLIDCWAAWCSPCMALVPDLKQMYTRWHKDGLEIIGVSFDQDPENVRRASKEHRMSWPQVLVPTEGKARQLWQEAAGIESIPRVLVIDRAGVLRFDKPDKLEEVVARLLGVSEQQAPGRSKP